MVEEFSNQSRSIGNSTYLNGRLTKYILEYGYRTKHNVPGTAVAVCLDKKFLIVLVFHSTTLVGTHSWIGTKTTALFLYST